MGTSNKWMMLSIEGMSEKSMSSRLVREVFLEVLDLEFCVA